MKKSELENYIRENIISTLSENTYDAYDDYDNMDLSKLNPGQKAALDVWLEQYHEATFTDRAGFQKMINKFAEVENANDLADFVHAEFAGDRAERQYFIRQLEKAYLDDDQPLDEAAIKEPINLKDALDRYSFGEILDTAAEHYEEDGEKDMALLARQTAAKFRKMLDDFDGGITEDEVAVAGMDDDDDKDAIRQAKAARGKNKKYDIVLNSLKRVETEMRSLARKYSKADGVEKDNILKKLKDLTNQRNELKNEVEKYADKLV